MVSSSTRSASGTRCGCRAPERLAGVGGAGERADLDLGVAEQQPQQLAPGVPAGSGDGDPVLVMCMTIHTSHVHVTGPNSGAVSARAPRFATMARLALRRLPPTPPQPSPTRFREVLADCDPDAPGARLPRLDAADLLWHLAGVHGFWATIVAHAARPAAEDLEEPERPASYDELLAAFDDALRRAGRRARRGRPGRGGLALVGRADRRHHLPPPGARGADPPARRRADRRRTSPRSTRRSPPTASTRRST